MNKNEIYNPIKQIMIIVIGGLILAFLLHLVGLWPKIFNFLEESSQVSHLLLTVVIVCLFGSFLTIRKQRDKIKNLTRKPPKEEATIRLKKEQEEILIYFSDNEQRNKATTRINLKNNFSNLHATSWPAPISCTNSCERAKAIFQPILV